MKSLVLLLLGVAAAHALILQFHNRCDRDIDLLEVDPTTNKMVSLNTIEKKTSWCMWIITDWHKYKFGEEGKTLIEIRRSLMRAYYEMDAINGLDFPIRMTPTYSGMVNGTILECKAENCSDAIWQENERDDKMQKTLGDTIHIAMCSDEPKGNQRCKNNDPNLQRQQRYRIKSVFEEDN